MKASKVKVLAVKADARFLGNDDKRAYAKRIVCVCLHWQQSPWIKCKTSS